jgi:hypothetical protein
MNIRGARESPKLRLATLGLSADLQASDIGKDARLGKLTAARRRQGHDLILVHGDLGVGQALVGDL